jgi:hypothetical protein
VNLPESEYSEKFDEHRKNRVTVSFYKYGTAKKNFGERIVEALPTAKLCIEKYLRTKNTEYLTDAANYLMFEFMYPSIDGAYFKATSEKESAGIVGISIKEMEDMQNESY